MFRLLPGGASLASKKSTHLCHELWRILRQAIKYGVQIAGGTQVTPLACKDINHRRSIMPPKPQQQPIRRFRREAVWPQRRYRKVAQIVGHNDTGSSAHCYSEDVTICSPDDRRHRRAKRLRTYGARALWSRSARSTRGGHGPPGRPGEPSTGGRGTGVCDGRTGR